MLVFVIVVLFLGLLLAFGWIWSLGNWVNALECRQDHLRDNVDQINKKLDWTIFPNRIPGHHTVLVDSDWLRTALEPLFALLDRLGLEWVQTPESHSLQRKQKKGKA